MSWDTPIDIYLGTPKATAAQWYNAVVSNLLADEKTPYYDDLTALLLPIAQYAAAVTFVKWAHSADADIEQQIPVSRITAALITEMSLFFCITYTSFQIHDIYAVTDTLILAYFRQRHIP